MLLVSAQTWVLKSKLAPPLPPPDLVHGAWLPTGELPPATLLLAGPGYGKTLGLLALLERASDCPSTWLTLDETDDEPASFFHLLIAGLRAHVPQFGEELEAMLAGEQLEPKRLWKGYFQAIARYALPGFVLVLDNVHHLQAQQPELLKGLVYWLDKLPDGVRVLLASRHRLPGLGRLTADGTLYVVPQERLRFSSEATESFLTARAAPNSLPEAWRARAAELDGWPLGLDLLARLGPERAPGLLEGALRRTLDDYVAEELVATQPAALQAFMLESALLHELTPDACRAVLAREDAAQALEDLETAHMLERLNLPTPTYRFAPYVRRYLLAESERRIPADRRAVWQRAAAEFYLSRQEPELALPHLVAGGDFAQALDVGERCFPAMRLSGRQAVITRWLAAFPDAIENSAPQLVLWRGQLAARAGAHDEALALLERAWRSFEAREDAAGAFKALVQRCSLAFVKDDMRTFGKLLLQALAQQQAGRDEDRVDLQLIRGRSAEQRGDLALMAECNRAVLAVPIGDNLEIAASHCIACLNLFTLAHHHGALDEARAHLEKLIAIAAAHRFHPYRTLACFLRAHLQLLAGDGAEAAAFLGALPADWEEALEWLDRALAHVVLGAWHQSEDRWDEAERALRRSLAVFERADYREGKKVPLERLLWLALRRGQPAEVSRWLAEVHAPGWPGEETPTSIHDLALAVPLARALQLQGEPATALALLDRLMPALEEQAARVHLARAHLVRAAVLAQLADARTDEARARAAEAAAAYPFLLRDDPGLRPAAPTASMRAEAGPLLQLRLFGPMEVLVGEAPIAHWPRRKSKLILAALAMYPRGLSPSELLDCLGPQAGESASSLKQSVSTLRKTLEPNLGAREASRYLQFSEDRYVLRWEAIGGLDLREFEAALQEGERLATSAPDDAAAAFARALAVYQGPLLGGGTFEAFFEAERRRCRAQAVAACTWLADYHGARADWAGGEAALERAIAIAPCEEDAYLALMRLHAARGREERMRQVYWDCRKTLKAQLGATPSAEFEAAYRAMRGAPS